MVMACDLVEYQAKVKAENARQADPAQRADAMGLLAPAKLCARPSKRGPDRARDRVQDRDEAAPAVGKILSEIKSETLPGVENEGSSSECPVKRFKIPVKITDKCLKRWRDRVQEPGR